MATPSPTFRSSLRTLIGALAAAPLVMLVAMSFVLVDGLEDTPPWALGVLAADVLLGVVALQAFRLRTLPAIPPGTASEEARRSSAQALQANLVLRFAIAEMPALVSVALAFTVESGGLLLVVLGVLVTEALLAWYVWPGDRVVAEVRAALERNGGLSYLDEALDAPPTTTP